MHPNHLNTNCGFDQAVSPFGYVAKFPKAENLTQWLKAVEGKQNPDDHSDGYDQQQTSKIKTQKLIIVPPISDSNEDSYEASNEEREQELESKTNENFIERYLEALNKVKQVEANAALELQEKLAKIEGFLKEECREKALQDSDDFQMQHRIESPSFTSSPLQVSEDDSFRCDEVKGNDDNDEDMEQLMQFQKLQDIAEIQTAKKPPRIEYVYQRRWLPRQSTVRRVNVALERWSLERYKENWQRKMKTDTLRTKMIPVIKEFLEYREQNDSFRQNLLFMDEVCESLPN